LFATDKRWSITHKHWFVADKRWFVMEVSGIMSFFKKFGIIHLTNQDKRFRLAT